MARLEGRERREIAARRDVRADPERIANQKQGGTPAHQKGGAQLAAKDLTGRPACKKCIDEGRFQACPGRAPFSDEDADGDQDSRLRDHRQTDLPEQVHLLPQDKIFKLGKTSKKRFKPTTENLGFYPDRER